MTTPTPQEPPERVSIEPEVWLRIRVVLERLAASSDLREVLGLIIDSVRDCLHAERASVFQYDRETNELFATRAHGVDESLRFSAHAGLAGEAVRTGMIVNVPDCYADPRFNREIDRRTGFRTRCMLTIPLTSFDGGLEGVAQVLNKSERFGGVFDVADEAIARALASQAAVAIRRARLIEAERVKNKYEADLAVARTIQQSTLPHRIHQASGYDIAAATTPADETGGDTFDVLDLAGLPGIPGRAGAAPESQHGVLLFVADATGHGIGPALSVAQVHAMVRMAARLHAPLPAIVDHLNRQLCNDLPFGRFVTGFIGILDPQQHRVFYISAGQAPILVVRAGGSEEVLEATTLPFGIDPELEPGMPSEIALEPGDVLALLSDGFYEAPNPAGELFGTVRVIDVIRGASPEGADAIVEALRAATHGFSQGAPLSDDQTAVVVLRRSR